MWQSPYLSKYITARVTVSFPKIMQKHDLVFCRWCTLPKVNAKIGLAKMEQTLPHHFLDKPKNGQKHWTEYCEC